jgi:hypothetical protein
MVIILFSFRLTDLCEYCEKEIDMRRRISNFMSDEGYEYQENYDITQIRTDFYEKALEIKRLNNEASDILPQRLNYVEKYKKILEDLKDYEVTF